MGLRDFHIPTRKANMLVQINRILVPTDFSEPAKQAQEYAIAFHYRKRRHHGRYLLEIKNS
jgi:hypothetical protein